MGLIKSNEPFDHFTEFKHLYYAATGATELKTRLEYAEHMRDEADYLSFYAAQLIGKYKRELEEIKKGTQVPSSLE